MALGRRYASAELGTVSPDVCTRDERRRDVLRWSRWRWPSGCARMDVCVCLLRCVYFMSAGRVRCLATKLATRTCRCSSSGSVDLCTDEPNPLMAARFSRTSAESDWSGESRSTPPAEGNNEGADGVRVTRGREATIDGEELIARWSIGGVELTGALSLALVPSRSSSVRPLVAWSSKSNTVSVLSDLFLCGVFRLSRVLSVAVVCRLLGIDGVMDPARRCTAMGGMASGDMGAARDGELEDGERCSSEKDGLSGRPMEGGRGRRMGRLGERREAHTKEGDAGDK